MATIGPVRRISLQAEPRGQADQPECHHHDQAFEGKAHHTTIVLEWCDDIVTGDALTHRWFGTCADLPHRLDPLRCCVAHLAVDVATSAFGVCARVLESHRPRVNGIPDRHR